MFDQSISDAAYWPDELSRGDIVLFRFPAVESGLNAAKMRPCLVLDLHGHGNNRRATLAYGTSAQTAANRGYEIWVKRRSSMATAGLNRPTRFVGSRRISTLLCQDDFRSGPLGSPVIGKLDDYLLKRMHAIRARLQADHDIAMETLQEKRDEHKRWLCEDSASASRELSKSALPRLREGVA
ncbi:hypothetical protein GLP43_13190 [Sulfitobacter sp. M39]|uniref:hypothetical protein n=1 Tax=Sulfitobacter sp. M39 TaxID=2675334 RepID=UPI001F2CB8B1|nr:hypothetical protein [Sulfitobacter sp. M39]MCF7748513.1 hypothetical protein [Sulfitobacter sp. M39]